MQSQYNMRSPAVKRLMKEAQELKDPTEQYHVQPLDDNLFEWHFTIRGPVDSDFDGGIYHGRIILPPDYPMKPPSIILLTPNGRFEVFKKICLSISGHHPESWQPSWSIRTALLAIIGFMPTHGAGAIGSLDYTPEERKVLAKKSREWKCPNCGSLEKLLLPVTQASEKTTQEAKELASQINFQGEKSKTSESSASTSTKEAPDPDSQESSEPSSPPPPPESPPSNPAAASAQPQPQFPWNQFMGGIPPNLFSPPPFPMPFMPPANSNTMVPRFPLPCYAPMVPPTMFPSGFPRPWFQAPPTSVDSNQSASNTQTSPAPSAAVNQSQSRHVQNDSTSTKPNTTTDTPTASTSVTSDSRNQAETQSATSASSSSSSPPSSPSSSSSPSQAPANSSDTASTGLRQRTTTANTRQTNSTFQSAELTPTARSDGMVSLVLIIVLSCAIGLLLFRRIYASFEWNSLFR